MTSAPTSIPSSIVRGRFGAYGGQYVPETIMPALAELETGFRQCLADESFQSELQRSIMRHANRWSLWPLRMVPWS